MLCHKERMMIMMMLMMTTSLKVPCSCSWSNPILSWSMLPRSLCFTWSRSRWKWWKWWQRWRWKWRRWPSVNRCQLSSHSPGRSHFARQSTSCSNVISALSSSFANTPADIPNPPLSIWSGDIHKLANLQTWTFTLELSPMSSLSLSYQATKKCISF